MAFFLAFFLVFLALIGIFFWHPKIAKKIQTKNPKLHVRARAIIAFSNRKNGSTPYKITHTLTVRKGQRKTT